jgi:predicted transcriptional regulator
MMISERKNTRGRIEILASILVHCKEGIKKTHIMCKANIGYEQLCYYLPYLIENGLVMQDIDEGCVIYRTTDAGREFLKFYFGIMKVINQGNNKKLPQAITSEKKSTFVDIATKEQNKPLISMLEETEC